MSRIVNAVERAEMERRLQRTQSPGGRGVQEMIVPSSPASWAPMVAKSESWEEAMALVSKQLQECEQQLANQSSDQAKRQERLAQLEEEKKNLSALQLETSEKSVLLEKSRLAWTRQLDALKECALLSRTYREAEQALQANQQRIAATQESQNQLANTLAAYQQQQADLQKQAEQVRFRLANALAATGTTDQRAS